MPLLLTLSVLAEKLTPVREVEGERVTSVLTPFSPVSSSLHAAKEHAASARAKPYWKIRFIMRLFLRVFEWMCPLAGGSEQGAGHVVGRVLRVRERAHPVGSERLLEPGLAEGLAREVVAELLSAAVVEQGLGISHRIVVRVVAEQFGRAVGIFQDVEREDA